MIIAFSGLDGSGKSTQADMAARFFKNKGFKVKRHHVIRNSLSFFVVHKILGKISGPGKAHVEEGLRKERGNVNFIVFSFLKKAVLLIDIIIFNLRYYPCKMSRKKVLIADRYFSDELIQAEYLGIAGYFFIEAMNALVIAPDKAFYFKVDPAIAFKRKNEYDINYFKHKADLYDDFFSRSDVIVMEPDDINKTWIGVKNNIEYIANTRDRN